MSNPLPEGAVFAGAVLGIDHITLPVTDVPQAERFYVGLLGATVLMRIDDAFLRRVGAPPEPADTGPRFNSRVHTSVRFGNAGPRIDLFKQHRGQPDAETPHPHVALGVRPEDLDRLGAALARAGVPTDGPWRMGPPGQASLYFNDPFGNHLELATMGYERELPFGTPALTRLVYTWRG